ncbi:class I SAM-dependent methyltransferase [Sphingobacterium bovistauri]|uniref:SAM-dependent methyltransferase n=1 Tax=Sphingobacterium bovistauri TaxID=2781959 RepID=A0ABS7Z5M1_9SPHI|nr:SAM-dependent methyltransferase [Sphingobacterium bovistauri]MCA5004842.1 SAM-dependent methyltransferase [Sphingobacterium bovistauri]
MTVLTAFIAQIKLSIQNQHFIKLSLGNYKGEVEQLKNIYVKAILIKRELKLSFTYRYKTRDITKNFGIEEGLTEIVSMMNPEGFRIVTLFTSTENVICELNAKQNWITRDERATAEKPISLTHDKIKERKIGDSNKTYLKDLRLTDESGKVYKNAQDKWKQINHYIELLSTELTALPQKDMLQVVDMGAGKGYLTFALYDYLNTTLQRRSHIEGVEYREDLVELCNSIAANSGFDELQFLQGTIEDYKPKTDLDILIALHACDTATDDSIYKGIKHHANLIVVAPCCHKQVRRELEKIKAQNDLSFMTKHGIFLERHAEMLTDGIRSLILEYFGYQTKVMQFISDAHTPKNVMIVAVKKEISKEKKEDVLKQIKDIKSYFGIGFHYLERLCGLDK